MTNFEDRPRLSLEKAREELANTSGWIVHMLENDDGGWKNINGNVEYIEPTYSLMRHINCEWCDYCTQADNAYRSGIRYNEKNPLIHKAKADPYEDEKNSRGESNELK